jgi:methylenetetrahydrofolate reductase (NADPH)
MCVQERIPDILAKRFTVSVEVFPPRNGHSPKIIMDKIAGLRRLRPDFVSITKGAMGTMRGGTVPIGYMIAEKYGLTPLVHFRARDQPKTEVENLLIDHRYFGIRNILAVMGDPVAGESGKINPRTHNRYASELVEQIIQMNRGNYLPAKGGTPTRGEPTDFCIGVAAYPERGRKEELLVMRAKSGADFAITQMFFDPALYERYVRLLREAGIRMPIIAGVRPIAKPEHVEAAERLFKAKVPRWLKDAMGRAGAEEACIDFTVKLCRDVADAGAPGVHLFILNDVELAKEIVGRVREGCG